jgi:hypothetical protein
MRNCRFGELAFTLDRVRRRLTCGKVNSDGRSLTETAFDLELSLILGDGLKDQAAAVWA